MENKINFTTPTIQNNIDIKSYFFKIISYWKLFLVTIIISCAVANFMNDYQQKKYNLSTTISVKEENNPLFSTSSKLRYQWRAKILLIIALDGVPRRANYITY